MKHFGDITKISGFDIPLVDIVTGGSPCQDLSVAGKRAGLEGERSGLFMEQIRIIKEMREHDKRNRGADVDFRLLRPRFMVWENVPGAFSSNKGEDFRCVLEETAKIVCEDAIIPEPPKGKWSPSGCIMGDGWSIAWRVHDAQFWGVPQRRKRISLVADFGGSSAPEILFEREGVSGDSEQSEQERKEVAGAVGESINPSSYTLKIRGGCEVDSHGKKADNGGGERQGIEREVVIQGAYGFEPGVAQRLDPENRFVEESTPTLRANMRDNQTAVVYNGASVTSPINASSPKVGDPCHTLTDDSRNHVICIEGNGQRESHKGDGYRESETMYTLNTVEQHGVMLFEPRSQDGVPRIHENNVCPTLNTAQGGQRQPCIVDESCKSSISNCIGTEGNVPTVTESSSWDGSQIAPTLTANNASGSQRMPDKDNFNAIITKTHVEQQRPHIAADNTSCQEPITLTTEMTPKIDENGIGFSLRSRDYKDPPVVSYGLDRASFNQGKNAQYDFSVEEELAQPIVARGPGGVLSNQ